MIFDVRGSFDVSNKDFDREKLIADLYKYSHDEGYHLSDYHYASEEEVQKAVSTFNFQLLSEIPREELMVLILNGNCVGYWLRASSCHVILLHNQLTFQVGSGFVSRNFDNEDDFLGVSKKDLRKMNGLNITTIAGIEVPTDSKNFIYGFTPYGMSPSRGIDLLETRKEYWLRTITNPTMFVKDCLSINADMEDGLFTSDKDELIEFDGQMVTIECFLDFALELVPDLQDYLKSFGCDWRKLQREQRELCTRMEAMEERIDVTVKNGFSPRVNSVSTRAKYPSETGTSIWSSCIFLGSIGIEGIIESFDCGIWCCEETGNISATFVSSTDHTEYHSIQMAHRGVVTEQFKQTLKVNKLSHLTSIHKWIEKRARSRGYIK